MLHCVTSLKIQYGTMFHFNLRLVATYYFNPCDCLLGFRDLCHSSALQIRASVTLLIIKWLTLIP